MRIYGSAQCLEVQSVSKEVQDCMHRYESGSEGDVHLDSSDCGAVRVSMRLLRVYSGVIVRNGERGVGGRYKNGDAEVQHCVVDVTRKQKTPCVYNFYHPFLSPG